MTFTVYTYTVEKKHSFLVGMLAKVNSAHLIKVYKLMVVWKQLLARGFISMREATVSGRLIWTSGDSGSLSKLVYRLCFHLRVVLL